MEGIDMRYLGNVFNSSLIGEDDVDLNYYLQAYEELYKLCSLLGTIFGFVGSEISSKMDVLKKLKRSDTEDHFSTMKTMIFYEQNANLLYDSQYTSGSRTLLRLHRGLAFISMFLAKVHRLEMHEGTSEAGKQAYEATLAQYHTWFVRTGANIAMYALPTKEALKNRVCPENIDQCVTSLPSMLDALQVVYDRVQTFYEDNNLLGLP